MSSSNGKSSQPGKNPNKPIPYSAWAEQSRATAAVAPVAAGPDPEVVVPSQEAAKTALSAPRPLRRTFTQSYKDQILAQADQCTQPGQIGALLRREGLYSSHLADWRRQQERQQAEKAGLSAPSVPLAQQNRALRVKTKQLEKQLAQAQALLDLQKKVSQLLGITLETLPIDEDNL